MADIDWDSFTDEDLGFDTITDCDECGVEFDLEEEGHVEEDDAFCEPCFNNIFGKDN